MDFEIIITLTVLIVAFLAFTLDLWTPDAVLLTAVGVVTATGVISLEQATRQFGNTTIVALGSLYVIAAALQKSGALNRASVYILGKGKKRIRLLLLRMSPKVSVYSGFFE